ncbi:hypothetical protein LIER_19514 [Lithospermum erythrorhizon]|uniref:Uncharacterized protein n=1 Tax=Lithospermum erythrorhizon TaxID=34254 RepID=A0AAV3QJ49_LITER
MKPSSLIILFLFFVSAKTISAARQPQWKGAVLSETIKGRTADEVWPLFQDFCNLYEIFPIDVSFCTLPLSDPLIRFLATKVPSRTGDNSTIVSWEKHQVLEMNSKKRFLRYKMMENNQGIKTYLPTVSVLEKKDGIQIKWDFVMDPVVGVTIEDVRNNLKLILASAVVNIEKVLSKST